MMTGNRSTIDRLSLRQALGCFTTGVVVATTRGDNNAPVGMTINSFSSVSLDPPLILWSIALNAPSLTAFRTHPGFTINILSNDQQSTCTQFAQPAKDKFKGIDWHPGYEDTPVIRGALAVLQCRAYQRYEGGDHEILVGEVMAISFNEETPAKMPLVFHRGTLTELAKSDE